MLAQPPDTIIVYQDQNYTITRCLKGDYIIRYTFPYTRSFQRSSLSHLERAILDELYRLLLERQTW